jgi:hypothetical protein
MRHNRLISVVGVALAIGSTGITTAEVPEWVQFYAGPAPGAGRDEAFDIAVGADGSCAVTGRSFLAGQDFGFHTIKYSPTGTQMWSVRYDGPLGNAVDEGRAVGMDAAGNVYVTGPSYNGIPPAGTDWDYVTIKYASATGNVLWTRRHHGPGSYQDLPYDISVDPSGDVYVCGYSFHSRDQLNRLIPHAHVIKYDTLGNVLWNVYYDLHAHLGAAAYMMRRDPAGNLYVGGAIGGGDIHNSDDDLLAMKITPAGQLVYAVSIDRSVIDWFGGIGCDAAGNAYLTGFVHHTEQYAVTAKLGPAGQVQWVREKVYPDGGAKGHEVVADADGNVYVVGLFGNSQINDGIVFSYDAAGVERWSVIYDEPQSFDDQWMRGVRLGSDGNLYVNVMTEWPDAEVYDYTIFVYSPTGTLLAQRRVGFSSTSDIAFAFELGANDSIYMTGFTSRGAIGPDYATIKLTGTTVPPTPGDVDGDGDVDLADLSMLLTAFGSCSGDPGYNAGADFNASGCVDLSDLAVLLGNFGT